MPGCGLDIGTSFLIRAKEEGEGIEYNEFRDAFYKIKPATLIAANMLEKGLKNLAYFKDSDGSFVIVGSDAIQKAIERNDSVKRPLFRGVLSPKEPDARKVLKFILSQVLGSPLETGETLVYSVPAEPIDQSEEEFNTGYHEDVLKRDLSDLGWNPQPLNEAEAVCYSELENDEYTGICMSFGAGMVNICVMSSGEPVLRFSTTKCLAKDTLISTERGLVPIKDIKPGDVSTDYLGHQQKVLEVLNNGYREKLTCLKVRGYSEPILMTSDHRVFAKIKKDLNWDWYPISELSKGDSMGIPIVKAENASRSLYLYRDKGEDFRLPKSRDLGQFLGYFLGDGTAYTLKQNPSDGRIACSFNAKKNKEQIEIYTSLLNKLFGKNCSREERHDQSCIVLRCNSLKLSRALKRLCYDQDSNKALQVPINQIPHQMALGLVEGMLATDGWVSNKKFFFENTSSSLVLLLQDLLARFGIKTCLTVRPPRSDGINQQGVRIEGKKVVYRIAIGSQKDNVLLNYLMSQSDNCNLPITDQNFIERRINNLSEVEYRDNVYDLVMESPITQCFNSPAGILHNSGDWIDRMAAQSTATPDSVIQVEKELGSFTVGQESDNPILSAVSAYYIRLIDYTVSHLSSRLTNNTDLPKFTDPISIVVSGGTSRAEGFIPAFRERLSKEDFPLQIKEVRPAKDPLRAVARGCLIASTLGI